MDRYKRIDVLINNAAIVATSPYKILLKVFIIRLRHDIKKLIVLFY